MTIEAHYVFPNDGIPEINPPSYGISLRSYVAARIFTGLICNDGASNSEMKVKLAVKLTDLLIEELNQNQVKLK